MLTEIGEIKVTTDGKCVRTIPAEFVPVPLGRGSPIGMTDSGILYAAFATEGPGLESTLLRSTNGGRSWTERRLDWWQFFNHAVGRDSPEFLFWDNRWAMRNQSFGVLKNGGPAVGIRGRMRWTWKRSAILSAAKMAAKRGKVS